MTKADFQKLADIRVREAKILLDAGEHDGAYYLAGYAVEAALKACIIRMLNTSDAWQESGFSNKCWKHDLESLLELAGLKAAISTVGPVLVQWAVVKDWTEHSRYEHGKTHLQAQQLYDAITDPTDGVLQWLKTRW
jgi:hypothetical protein